MLCRSLPSRCNVIRWGTKMCQAAKYLWGKIVSHFKTVYVRIVSKQDHRENPDVYERIKLSWIFRKWVGGGGMGWIDLAQDRDRWWALVNWVINLPVA